MPVSDGKVSQLAGPPWNIIVLWAEGVYSSRAPATAQEAMHIMERCYGGSQSASFEVIVLDHKLRISQFIAK